MYIEPKFRFPYLTLSNPYVPDSDVSNIGQVIAWTNSNIQLFEAFRNPVVTDKEAKSDGVGSIKSSKK